jgi:hypothetical protein
LKRLGLKLVNFPLSDRPQINNAGSAKNGQVFILSGWRSQIRTASRHRARPIAQELDEAEAVRLGQGAEDY